MKLQDYIHYYIGCRCLNAWFIDDHEQYNNNWVLSGYSYCSVNPYQLFNKTEVVWTDSIKPILRKLEDITDDECWRIDEIDSVWAKGTSFEYKKNRLYLYKDRLLERGEMSIIIFDFLLKSGFDLFGLIDAGLAIDSKTLK